MMKLRKSPPVRFCHDKARPYMMKAVVNQLKYMMRVWMRRVGWRIMSVKLPLLAAALGLVRTISSTGTYFPFFLLASDRTFFASSMRDLNTTDIKSLFNQKRTLQ